MATVGYARVSTIGQNLGVQLEKLREYGCEEIFEEKRSGWAVARPALKECLRYIRHGDVLVITRLDRLERSTLDDMCRVNRQIDEECEAVYGQINVYLRIYWMVYLWKSMY